MRDERDELYYDELKQSHDECYGPGGFAYDRLKEESINEDISAIDIIEEKIKQGYTVRCNWCMTYYKEDEDDPIYECGNCGKGEDYLMDLKLNKDDTNT